MRSVADVNAFRLLHLSSLHRNRKEYPNPCQFVVPIQKDPLTIQDPVATSSNIGNGIITALSGSSVSFTLPYLTRPNFLINKYVNFIAPYEAVKISSWSGSSSNTATLVSAPLYSHAIGDKVFNSVGPPYAKGSLTANGSTTTAVIEPVVGNLLGKYIILVSDDANYLVTSIITNVNGNTVTFTPAAPLSTYTNEQYIISDVYDNYETLNSSSNDDRALYAVELKSLEIPNFPLKFGTITNLQFSAGIFVILRNTQDISGQSFPSNSPHSLKATFYCPITDVQNNVEIQSNFIRLTRGYMNQPLWFSFDDPIYFEIYQLDGTPIVFSTSDNMSPLPPDPLYQVNAFFSFKKIQGKKEN